MSILNYFSRRKPAERGSFVPSVSQTSRSLSSQAISSANKEVERAEAASTRRAAPSNYSSAQRANIGKYAAIHGSTAASRHFSSTFGHPVPESTARKFRDIYRAELERRKRIALDEDTDTVVELPPKKRGRPLLLQDLDGQVQEYVRKLRLAGGVINTTVVLAAAKGIVMAHNRALPFEFGGSICLEKPWVKSSLHRMGYVKRRGTTSGKVPVVEFERIKEEFLTQITSVVEEQQIPPELVFNIDETGIHLVPVSNWTMDKEGSQRVKLEGIDDK